MMLLWAETDIIRLSIMAIDMYHSCMVIKCIFIYNKKQQDHFDRHRQHQQGLASAWQKEFKLYNSRCKC